MQYFLRKTIKNSHYVSLCRAYEKERTHYVQRNENYIFCVNFLYTPIHLLRNFL